jgi:hypothetical protein
LNVTVALFAGREKPDLSPRGAADFIKRQSSISNLARRDTTRRIAHNLWVRRLFFIYACFDWLFCRNGRHAGLGSRLRNRFLLQPRDPVLPCSLSRQRRTPGSDLCLRVTILQQGGRVDEQGGRHGIAAERESANLGKPAKDLGKCWRFFATYTTI